MGSSVILPVRFLGVSASFAFLALLRRVGVLDDVNDGAITIVIAFSTARVFVLLAIF